MNFLELRNKRTEFHESRPFGSSQTNYVSESISKLQIQVATYVFELSAGNCHR
jgi:hypothetical protein